MGVPGFFAWLRRKYPQIVDDSATAACDGEGDACDNLYVGKDPLAHMASLQYCNCHSDDYVSSREQFELGLLLARVLILFRQHSTYGLCLQAHEIAVIVQSKP